MQAFYYTSSTLLILWFMISKTKSHRVPTDLHNKKDDIGAQDNPDIDYDIYDLLQDDIQPSDSIKRGENQTPLAELEQLTKAEGELENIFKTKGYGERLPKVKDDFDMLMKAKEAHEKLIESSRGEKYKKKNGMKSESMLKGHQIFPVYHKQQDKHVTETKKHEDMANHNKKYSKHSHHTKNTAMGIGNVNRIPDSSKSRFVPNSRHKVYKSRPQLNSGGKKTKDSFLNNYDQDEDSSSGLELLQSRLSDKESSNISITLEENDSPWDVRCNASDSKLWIGIAIGVGACLTVATLVGSVFVLMNKRRGCNHWRRFANTNFSACVKDEQPVYIKLSQLHGKRKNNGCNYIVTVLDESNFSVDSSWSSEDELFGMSDIMNRSADRAREKRYL
ncbi:uncharacterized protein LOC121384005 isoform X2 [Gigantopelta aegis]|uniref:uncharacterized protein LOC121384005 isoform X2 n=1 Tax=Gigantopelta aegis TaxID=1735272 RepID=UPI001B889AC4|nr:uncharacterized protein LOC121384005 isoform X2 [Gigantopelta aegis]